jgi:hypothetical protein
MVSGCTALSPRLCRTDTCAYSSSSDQALPRRTSSESLATTLMTRDGSTKCFGRDFSLCYGFPEATFNSPADDRAHLRWRDNTN